MLIDSSLRISVKWDTTVPVFSSCAGVLVAEKQVLKTTADKGTTVVFEEVFKCKFSYTPGGTSLSSIDEKTPMTTKTLDELRDYIDLIIKSYCYGTTLTEESFFWVHPKRYFSVTKVDIRKFPGDFESYIHKTHCVGILNSFEEAVSAVKNISPSILTDYPDNERYCIIEQFEPGLFPIIKQEVWFKWNSELKEYKGCNSPHPHLKNIGIG